MTLKGNLEDLALGDILHVVGAARRSGRLTLDAGARSAVLIFREGTVVAARAPGVPADALALSVATGLVDAATADALSAQAAAQGKTPSRLLIDSGSVTPGALRRALEPLVEGAVRELLGLDSGTFEFHLIDDEAALTAEHGELVLEPGLTAARLLAERGRPPVAPEGRPLGSVSVPPQRAARLLVREDALSLPGAPRAPERARDSDRRAAAPPRPAPPPPQAEAPEPEDVLVPVERPTGRIVAQAPGPRRTLFHALPAGPLRQQLLSRLVPAGIAAMAVTSVQDLRAAVEAASGRGERLALCGHASHATLPGAEAVARLRSLAPGVPAVLLVDEAWPIPQQAVVVERALRLGAQVVALVPGDTTADTVAADLLARLEGLLSPDPLEASPVVPLDAASGDEPLAAGGDGGRRRDVARLVALARWLAAAGEASEIALALAEVAAEHASGGALYLERDGTLEPLAVVQPSGTSRAATAALTVAGAGLLGRCVREARDHVGPVGEDTSDAAWLQGLGVSGATPMAVLPLVVGDRCLGALAAAGLADQAPDLTALRRFVDDAAPALHEALSRQRRRADARRMRLGG